MLYKKEQCFMITAATLFLIGAIFMLVNTFGGQEWALWVGLGFAIAAVLIYVLIRIQGAAFNKKYTVSEQEIIAAEQKATAAPTAVTTNNNEEIAGPAANPIQISAEKPKQTTAKAATSSKSTTSPKTSNTTNTTKTTKKTPTKK